MFTSQTFVAMHGTFSTCNSSLKIDRLSNGYDWILLTWVLILVWRSRKLSRLKLQSRGTTIGWSCQLLLICVSDASSKVCMRTSAKTIHYSIELSVSLSSCRGSHAWLLLSLWGAIVFVIRCVCLCLFHRIRESARVLRVARKGSPLLVSTELVAGSRNTFFICSPLLRRELTVLLFHIGAIDLNLFELLDVTVYLSYVDLAGVVFVKYFEYRLVFLLINAKVIGCHYCKACWALLII